MGTHPKKTKRRRQAAPKALKRAPKLPGEQEPQSTPERTAQETQTSPSISQTEPIVRVRTRKPGEVRATSPPVYEAVPRNSPLLPPHAEDASIRDAHDVHVIPIVRASIIQSKVRQTISLLQAEQSHAEEAEAGEGQAIRQRDVLVALIARASDANKCVSVTEIAKRELARDANTEIFQYTGVWSQLEDYMMKPPSDVEKDISADEELDETPDFESFDFNERPKVRNVSCLVIYLARSSISKLKDVYGEQKQTPKHSVGF